MRDLWELLGRFVAAGNIPATIATTVQTALLTEPSPNVTHAEIENVQGNLATEYPLTPVSLFAAGEVVRITKVAATDALVLYNSGFSFAVSSSPSFFECLGLILVDPTIRLNARGGAFGPYQNLLTPAEKASLTNFVNAPSIVPGGSFISDDLGNQFRNAVWGGGSCRIAAVMYAQYVHTP